MVEFKIGTEIYGMNFDGYSFYGLFIWKNGQPWKQLKGNLDFIVNSKNYYYAKKRIIAWLEK